MTNKRKLSDNQPPFPAVQGASHQNMDYRANGSSGRPAASSPGPFAASLRSPSEETIANSQTSAFGKPEVFARVPAVEYLLSHTGNLYIQLTVSNNPIRFLVLSETLRLASAVWSNLINPRSPMYRVEHRKLTSAGGPAPFLDVQGDDPEALLCFLRIVHLDTEKVPRKLSFSQLRSMALLCEKYDCVKALGLWKEHWVDQFTLEHRLNPGYEDWLAVDAVFGNKNHFLQLMQTIVRESRLGGADQNGIRNLFRYNNRANGNGNPKKEPESSEGVIEVEPKDCIPPEVMDEIRKLREDMIGNLFVITRQYASYLLHTPAEGTGPRARYECKESCMTMAYGCFARSAERNSVLRLIFTSRFKINERQESPAELYEKLRNIQFLLRSEPRLCQFDKECGLKDIQVDFLKSLENVMRVTANVDKYMKFKEEKQWRWEKIDLPAPNGGNAQNLPMSQMPSSTFKSKMNHALQKKGK